MDLKFLMSLLESLLREGAPIAVAVVASIAWFLERKEKLKERDVNKDMQNKLLTLAQSQVESTIKTESSINTLTTVLNQVLNRL